MAEMPAIQLFGKFAEQIAEGIENSVLFIRKVVMEQAI